MMLKFGSIFMAVICFTATAYILAITVDFQRMALVSHGWVFPVGTVFIILLTVIFYYSLQGVDAKNFEFPTILWVFLGVNFSLLVYWASGLIWGRETAYPPLVPGRRIYFEFGEFLGTCFPGAFAGWFTKWWVERQKRITKRPK